MQNITKTSPFFCVWRKTILRKSYLDFSKCSCHLHSYRKIRRCIDKNQTQLNNEETSLVTYSIIQTLQKQFCLGKLKVPSKNMLCIYSHNTIIKKMIIKVEQLHCLSKKTVYAFLYCCTLHATMIYRLRSMFTWIFISIFLSLHFMIMYLFMYPCT